MLKLFRNNRTFYNAYKEGAKNEIIRPFKDTEDEKSRPFGIESDVKVTDLTPEMLVNVIKDKNIKTHLVSMISDERDLSGRINVSVGNAKQIVLRALSGEPYDTSYCRLALENTHGIINGMKIVMAALKIGEGVILLDKDASSEANSFSLALKENDNIKIILKDMKYPADNEHLIMHTLTSVEISRKRGAERMGCFVLDLKEALAISRAFLKGESEKSETVAISGDALKRPLNIEIPYGKTFREIADICETVDGCDSENTALIAGGVMHGREVSADTVFEPNMSPIVFLKKKKIPKFVGKKCIKCNACAKVCPMLLLPMYFYTGGGFGKTVAESFDMSACIECGACQYVCPSRIPILDCVRALKNGENPEKTAKGRATAKNTAPYEPDAVAMIFGNTANSENNKQTEKSDENGGNADENQE